MAARVNRRSFLALSTGATAALGMGGGALSTCSSVPFEPSDVCEEQIARWVSTFPCHIRTKPGGVFAQREHQVVYDRSALADAYSQMGDLFEKVLVRDGNRLEMTYAGCTASVKVASV
jgi:hypothetical protein